MFKRTVGLGLFALSTAMILSGCGASRDVEVTGEVTAPASLSINSDIKLQFVDAEQDKEAIAYESTMAELGKFTHTVSLEGNTLLVRAIVDLDSDGKCTAGEVWGEVEAKVTKEGDKESISGLSLTLSNAPCP